MLNFKQTIVARPRQACFEPQLTYYAAYAVL